MEILIGARRLANYILALDDFSIPTTVQFQSYGHMGAILTDAILQAGLNYRTVVAPRVNNVINRYPQANTTVSFLNVIIRDGANRVINWNHHEKPRRLHELSALLFEYRINTEDELREWLINSYSQELLLDIKGVGPKTVDYLKKLVNIQSVAIDRHIRKFVSNSGIHYGEYSEIKKVVEFTADLLDVHRSCLDYAIWSYMSTKKQE